MVIFIKHVMLNVFYLLYCNEIFNFIFIFMKYLYII